MEYIIIGLLVVILIVSIIALTKNVNESNITERLGKLETEMVKELGDFKSDINKNLNRAEILFYKGNYENALNLALDVIEKQEPGFKNKFMKECM